MTDTALTVKNFRIAIVGAGPAGLSTAIALKKKGFKNVVLFERDAGTNEAIYRIHRELYDHYL